MFWVPLLVAAAGCGDAGDETSGSGVDAGAERTSSEGRGSDDPAPGDAGAGHPSSTSPQAPEVPAVGADGGPEVPLDPRTPSEPTPSEPTPSKPTSEPPCGPSPSEASPSEPSGSGEFIPWSEFADAATFGLGSDQGIRSVAAHAGYSGESLILAVSSDTGNNEVLAVNLEERSLRQLWFHRDCGDCQLESSGWGVLLANGNGLWESTDGGYRFAELGSWGLEGEANAEVIAGFRPWTLVGGSWRFVASYDETRVANWPADVASVDSDSALEINHRYVRIYGESPAVTPNPCASLPEAYRWGRGWHWGHAVLIPCGDATIAFNPDLAASEVFVDMNLDAPASSLHTLRNVRFHGGISSGAQPPASEMSVLIATARSWYVFEVATAQLSRVAAQPEGPAGEQVLQYLDDQGTRGLRVSEQGIAVTAPFTP